MSEQACHRKVWLRNWLCALFNTSRHRRRLPRVLFQVTIIPVCCLSIIRKHRSNHCATTTTMKRSPCGHQPTTPLQIRHIHEESPISVHIIQMGLRVSSVSLRLFSESRILGIRNPVFGEFETKMKHESDLGHRWGDPNYFTWPEWLVICGERCSFYPL